MESHKQKFKSSYLKLNPEQKKAVDEIEGPVMVIAGPGTGKTHILATRIANILDKTDTVPEAILALTFTESAATAMRKRLSLLIGSLAYRVEITTFHSFANSIITHYPDHFPEIIGSVSITEVEQIKILKTVIDENNFRSLKPFGEKYYYLRPILSSINELKRQGISPESFEKIIKKTDFEDEKQAERNTELSIAYQQYEKALRKNQQYDYNDMIMRFMIALEKNKDLLLTLQEQYLYILVDEHQDTNSAQNKILELLGQYHKNPNMFAVGDEKQAIYRFQGASLENFLYFRKLYKGTKVVTLTENYRSTQTILDGANGVVPSQIPLIAKANHKEKHLSIASLSSTEAEYYFIAKKIQELISQGISPESIAVLYRENKDATPLALTLEKHTIPFKIESDQNSLEDEDIRKLLSLLRAIQHFGSSPELYQVLHLDFLGLEPLDIYKISSLSSKKRIYAYDIIKSEALLKEAGVESPEQFIKIYQKISRWKRNSKNKGAAQAFEDVVRESGFLAYILTLPRAMEKKEKLHGIFEHLKSLIEGNKSYSLEDFFEYLDLVQEHNLAIKSSDIIGLPGRVRLMTAHKSKGLEFDYVFIINAVDGKWGSKRKRELIKLPVEIYSALESIKEHSISDNDDDDEEKNIFYVAMTRAKKELYITYGQHNREGKEQLPARFIHQISPNLVSQIDVSEYEKTWTDNQEIEFSENPKKIYELKEKKFLNHLFLSQNISPTALNNFLDCPWHYFFVNLVRIPEAPNRHMLYGNAIHAALKDYFNQFERGSDGNKKYLLERFEESLKMQPFAEIDFTEALSEGKESLSQYYDNYHETWNSKVLTETRIDGISLNDHTKLSGVIDKMEFIDERNVHVVDYKTGTPRTRNAIMGKTASDNGDYYRQLTFYNLLLQKEGRYTMVSGEIDFIKPDKKSQYHKEKFEISQSEVDNLEQTILATSQSILDLDFWQKTCEKKECQYCELRLMTFKNTNNNT